MKYIFEFSEKGPIRLQVREEEGHLIQEIPEVFPTGEACARLGRSRRHVYRYVARGWLHPVVKFSGELFFDAREVKALESARPASRPKSPARRPSVPRRLKPLFPEYDLQTLEPNRDADLILSRILERGDAPALRWALRYFSRKRRCQFLKTQGQRLLSDRALRFWSWLWRVSPLPGGPAWRRGGWRLGGVA